jgi:hypothetical protein
MLRKISLGKLLVFPLLIIIVAIITILTAKISKIKETFLINSLS